MMKHLLSLPALGLVAALALPAAAQDASKVVATVNGTDITIGHMIVARATLPQQFQELPDQVLFDGILEQLVQQTLLAQSFEGELPPRATVIAERNPVFDSGRGDGTGAGNRNHPRGRASGI